MDLIYFSFLYAISAVSVCRFLFGANIRALHAMFFVLLFSGGGVFSFCGYSSWSSIGLSVLLNSFIGGAYMVGPTYKETFLESSRKSAGWIYVGILSFFLILLLWDGGGVMETAPFGVLGRGAYYIFCALIAIIFLFNVISILGIKEDE